MSSVSFPRPSHLSYSLLALEQRKINVSSSCFPCRVNALIGRHPARAHVASNPYRGFQRLRTLLARRRPPACPRSPACSIGVDPCHQGMDSHVRCAISWCGMYLQSRSHLSLFMVDFRVHSGIGIGSRLLTCFGHSSQTLKP